MDTEVMLYTPVMTARAVGYNSFMPSYPHIEQYRTKLQELIEFGGSDNEENIRPAFQNCLDAYCHDHRERLVLIPELKNSPGNKPDGTVKDSLRMARGYWEAKDSHDDLDAEIKVKFNRGYPADNIIFEDSQTAVLVQNGNEAMRVDMSRDGELHRLIRIFLDYELPEIQEFRQAQGQFKTDLPMVLENLRTTVAEAEAEAENPGYQHAAEIFLNLCRKTIGPAVSPADVREMLLQHILTKDIFQQVFSEIQFHRENNVARLLDELEQTFFTGNVRRQAINRLRTYYGAIGRAAGQIADYTEKQQFLKAIYEDFYTAYNPAAADRLGVVYTPNEVVDFIIRGADHLLQKHFGKTLADDNVQILDPATGTGTFITNLINHLPADRLEHKYLNEIHANEVAILPYYIANLNIEYTYQQRTGRYLEFPNLCFVDTLDNLDWKGASGGAVPRQSAFNLGGLSEENWIRIQEQNEKPISVIIGNPPYNDSQSNWNEFNPNREYPEIDKRIRETYVKESTAHKTHQYDMYKRFIRWASDRLDDDGIIAFVTNRAYLDARQDDGFRKVAASEFTDIYLLDLGSDVRRNPKISGTTHNVFGIQTGVTIGFFVRDKAKQGNLGIHYNRREDAELAVDKLAYLRDTNLEEIALEDITPDAKSYWLNQSSNNFDTLITIAREKLSSRDASLGAHTLFMFYSTGVTSHRDDWVYDFDNALLGNKVRAFINSYEESRAKFGGTKFEDSTLGTNIKWTSDLVRQLRSDKPNLFERDSIVSSIYRPFVSKYLYFHNNLNWSLYQMPRIFPSGHPGQNKIICFSGVSSSKPFQSLGTDKVVGLDTLEKTQCLPLYRYTEDGERVSNITQWGIDHINGHYRQEWGDDFQELAGEDGITAEEIFAYTYAVLHNPAYRHEYALDLLREFPRLPLYRDFHHWAEMGQKLLDLHIGFESAEPYPLERYDREGVDPKRAMLRADKSGGDYNPGRAHHAGGHSCPGLGVPAGQPLRPGVGAGPVQGKEAPRPDHP